MQDHDAASPQRKHPSGPTGTRLRVGLAITAMAATAIAGTGTATAKITEVPTTTAMRCHHPCSNPPAGGGWQYIDNYYWASSCIAAGNRGINAHLWARYECFGSTWTNYDLWVHR
jgi:hypothetical protein